MLLMTTGRYLDSEFYLFGPEDSGYLEYSTWTLVEQTVKFALKYSKTLQLPR